MKYIIGILAVLAAGYVGIQSFIIANVGAQNQIPQLEGDGGASVVFAVIVLIAAVLCFFRPLIASPIFLLGTLVGSLCAATYEDSLMYVWSIVSFLFAASSFLIYRFARKRQRTQPQPENLTARPKRRNATLQ